MSVAKIIELSAESPTSCEDAIVQGITKVSKTVHGIKSAWVKEQDVMIENGKVALSCRSEGHLCWIDDVRGCLAGIHSF